jgi:hypothetical protein
MDFKLSGHLDPALTDPATRTLRTNKLTGRWLNTNPDTQGIVECVIKQDGELFSIDISGAGPDGPIHWPTCRTEPLANLEEEAGQRTFALSATFDFAFMTAETYIRVNKGVLVIVLFASFRDSSKRSDYVNREFFYRPSLKAE